MFFPPVREFCNVWGRTLFSAQKKICSWKKFPCVGAMSAWRHRWCACRTVRSWQRSVVFWGEEEAWSAPTIGGEVKSWPRVVHTVLPVEEEPVHSSDMWHPIDVISDTEGESSSPLPVIISFSFYDPICLCEACPASIWPPSASNSLGRACQNWI